MQILYKIKCNFGRPANLLFLCPGSWQSSSKVLNIGYQNAFSTKLDRPDQTSQVSQVWVEPHSPL